MISSHYENNDGGAVRNLNRAEQERSRITAETPPFVVAALRDRELAFRNSKTLPEAYFAILGGNGRRARAIETALGQAYGTTALGRYAPRDERDHVLRGETSAFFDHASRWNAVFPSGDRDRT
jgi:hypothetical protein